MEVAWWWSWILGGAGVTGLWFAGNHKILGWQIGVGIQAIWITYAIVTQQWGFIASALAFGFVNSRNLIKWKKEQDG